ncbi:MAG: hypothetical protein AAF220_02370, partial [Pseudomonadota bacterium]
MKIRSKVSIAAFVFCAIASGLTGTLAVLQTREALTNVTRNQLSLAADFGAERVRDRLDLVSSSLATLANDPALFEAVQNLISASNASDPADTLSRFSVSSLSR